MCTNGIDKYCSCYNLCVQKVLNSIVVMMSTQGGVRKKNINRVNTKTAIGTISWSKKEIKSLDRVCFL